MKIFNGEQVDATEVAESGYSDLSRYTIRTRTYASVYDGLKAVYRRVIYASLKHRDHVKSATIVGDSMKYHPHGDSSLYSALIAMTNRYDTNYQLYDGVGNWGGFGFAAASLRYTEACLSSLGRMLVGEDLIDYVDYIEGDAGYMEPKALPMYIPYSLLVGCGGFGVGMPNPSVPPFDAMDLVNWYIDELSGKQGKLPNIDVGDCIIHIDEGVSEEEYLHSISRGTKVYYKGIITQESPTRFVITQMTPFRTLDNILDNKRIKSYLDDESVIFIDESTDSVRYVFEIENPNKANPTKILELLKSAMASSNTYKYIFEEDEIAIVCSVDYVMTKNLNYLRKATKNKYTKLREDNQYLIDVLRAIEVLKSSDLISRISKLSSDEVITYLVDQGFTDEVAKGVLRRSISYLTTSHLDEIEACKINDELYSRYINNPDEYLLDKYQELKSALKVEYDKKNHTIVTANPDAVSFVKKCKITESGINISSKLRGAISYMSSVYAFDESGWYKRVPAVSRSDRFIEVKEVEPSFTRLIGGCSDTSKYVILVEDNKYVLCKSVQDMQDYSTFITVTGTITSVVGVVSDKVRITGDKGTVISIDVADYCKTRKSKSIAILPKSESISSIEEL